MMIMILVWWGGRGGIDRKDDASVDVYIRYGFV